MTNRKTVLEADRMHLWHPYTPMDDWRANHRPLHVERASGSYLTLADGRRILDANASWWVASLGHNHPRLVAALTAQAHKLSHCALAGITHEPAAMLASELAQVAPKGLSQVFFSDDGSTAIEAAAKMCIQLFAQSASGQKKVRLVALEGAFHGETLGCASLGGVEVFRRPFASVVFDCVHVPSPAEGGVARATESITALLEREADSIAAIVIEPLIQGASGMRMYSPDYLCHLAAACRHHDVLLVADEVFVGYGRTGRMWACDHAGISPDILCVGKGFSGGLLPMGATITNERVIEGFSGGRSRAFLHGHSYCGNPLGAAVAREVLRVYRDEHVIEGTEIRATMIEKSFRAIGDRLGEHAIDVRCFGMIGAIELREKRVPIATVAAYETVNDVDSDYTASIGWRVYEVALELGAYLRPLGNVVYITPPLNISIDDLNRLLEIVRESIEKVLF